MNNTMLPYLHQTIERQSAVCITKTMDGEDVSALGAFPYGKAIRFTAHVPHRLGVSAVVLRLAPDGAEAVDYPFSFEDRSETEDRYTFAADTAALCRAGQHSGIFYYEYLFLRGTDTLFSDTSNRLDFTLSPTSGRKFLLSVYEESFSTPAWFHGGTMYHIFLDRFCKGEGPAVLREDAVLEPDWEHGIPQYAKERGGEVANNVFFGGNLWGVIEKLDALCALGITVLYLSPIFEAASNHRYDTGDYEHVDGLLGGDEAFAELVREAHRRGMKIVLDGVFNHTGDDSRYFNRKGRYRTPGAYQSRQSPYADWYNFRNFPDDYECWWNIKILPRLNGNCPACRAYFTGADGIVRKWLRAGADGWRLDVADELSDEFLDEMRTAVKEETDGASLLLGEVWENAADKLAYGARRRYFLGGQLDGVMNYPFRNAVLTFLREGDGMFFCDVLKELYASYPPCVCHSLMNVIGTHDTERILTLLGDDGSLETADNDTLSTARLTEGQFEKAKRLLKMAASLQYTVFGVPSLFYGDEAGLEGYHDPFCRRPFPWGREDRELMAHYTALGQLRRQSACLAEGSFGFLECNRQSFAFERKGNGERLVVLANMGSARTFHLDGDFRDALTGAAIAGHRLTVPTETVVILKERFE